MLFHPAAADAPPSARTLRAPLCGKKTSELYLSHFENVVVPAADMCVWVISGFPATNIFFILKERADQITIHKVMF